MRSVTFLLALLVALAPHPARADTPQQVQKQLQAICDRRAQGYYHYDLNARLSGYAPNYVFSTVRGHHSSFADLKGENAKQVLRHLVRPVFIFKMGQVTLHGNTAQADEKDQSACFVPRSATELSYHYAYQGVRQTTWVKGPTGWQETSAQMVRDVTIYSR